MRNAAVQSGDEKGGVAADPSFFAGRTDLPCLKKVSFVFDADIRVTR
jgi:hypothetical protein